MTTPKPTRGAVFSATLCRCTNRHDGGRRRSARIAIAYTIHHGYAIMHCYHSPAPASSPSAARQPALVFSRCAHTRPPASVRGRCVLFISCLLSLLGCVAPTVYAQTADELPMLDLHFLAETGRAVLANETQAIEHRVEQAGTDLGVADEGSPIGAARATVWGGADYRGFGHSNIKLAAEANVASGHLGFDSRAGRSGLLGWVLSGHESELALRDRRTATAYHGDHELKLASLHPYVGWTALDARLELWATVGYGAGTLEARGETVPQSGEPLIVEQEYDVTTLNAAVGLSSRFVQVRKSLFRLKSEFGQTRLELTVPNFDLEQTVDAGHALVSLEGRRTLHSEAGGTMVVSTELGVRHDSGGLEPGAGLLLGTGFHYTNPHGLRMEGNLHALLGRPHYDEWGVGAALLKSPNADERGLSLRASWDTTFVANASGVASGSASGFASEFALNSTPETTARAQLAVELGYGLGVGRARGVHIKPYGKLHLTNDDTHTYRVGSEVSQGRLTYRLENTRTETANAPTTHGLQFNLSRRW